MARALALTAVVACFQPLTPALAQHDRRVSFDMLDANSDGVLSQGELRRTPLVSQLAFLDANGDGALSREELGIVLDPHEDPSGL